MAETLGTFMADKCKEETPTALQNNDLPLAAEKAKKSLDESNNVPLNIAVTGESGSGKSTLVNALRGIRNKTEGAAQTGVVERTMKPTKYLHPEMPNIKIWDLPGVGTTRFPVDKYLEYVEFEKYDFFIIVSNDRFRENDAKLAQEIQKKKKKFYFVRSKIDHNIRDEKEENPNVKEEDVLKDVRENCTEELQKLGFESPKVFLVSGFKLDLYEFKNLYKTLVEDLPKLQMDALLLALPNISLDVIEQKKKTLGSKIKWYVVASAATAAVPVPGLSASVDLGMIVTFAVLCQKSLGLTPESLRKMSNEKGGVALNNLKAILKSPLAGVEITSGLVLKVLASSAVVITEMAIEEGARFVPLIGTLFAVCLSGVSTYKILTYILNSLAEDAHRVYNKAMRQ